MAFICLLEVLSEPEHHRDKCRCNSLNHCGDIAIADPPIVIHDFAGKGVLNVLRLQESYQRILANFYHLLNVMI